MVYLIPKKDLIKRSVKKLALPTLMLTSTKKVTSKKNKLKSRKSSKRPKQLLRENTIRLLKMLRKRLIAPRLTPRKSSASTRKTPRGLMTRHSRMERSY